MTSTSLLIAKVGASATGVAVVGGTSYVVVQHSTTIQNFFTSDKPTTTNNDNTLEETSPIQSPESVKDVKPEVAEAITKTPKDSTDFVYFIAEYSADGKNSSQSLYDSAKSNKEYLCQFENTDKSLIQNNTCAIFELAKVNTNKTLIKLTDTTATTSSEIKEISSLSAGSNYLLKLSKSFAESLATANKNDIEILHKTEETNNSFGKFTKLVDLSKDTQKVTPEAAQSNLFSVLITKKTTETTFDANSNYKCKIGTSDSLIECKVYKLSETYTSLAKDPLDKSVAAITQAADLHEDKCVLVELVNNQKTLDQLDGQIIIFQKANDSTEVAQGLAEQLLVGSANTDTSTQSNLYIVDDAYPTLTTGTVSGEGKAYILTEGSEKKPLPKFTTYSKTDYLCRVIANSQTFDDTDCKLYEFPKSTDSSFVFTDYKSSDATEIADIAKLASETYQVVELKRALQTELKKTGATLHLVKTDRKEKTINNKLVTLTWKADLADSDEETSTLKTNLFLVRYKNGAGSTATALTDESQLTCEIDSTSVGKCKIYKFAAAKKENALTADEIKGLTAVTNTNEFTEHTYFAIELTETRKGETDLKNKQFALKSATTEIGKFDFDQIIIGKAGEAGLPIKPEFDSYIVKLSGSWTNAGGATSYRCKFAAADSSSTIDNYDSSCKLVSVAPTAEHHIMAFETLKTAATKIEASALSTNTENFYKLIINNKLFYNLSFEANSSKSVVVEVIKDSVTSLASLEIKQKINDAAVIGKTNLLLGKVKGDGVAAAGTLSAGQCTYSDSPTVDTTNQFACELYKGTTGTDGTLTKITFTEEKFIPTSASLTTDEHYLISLTADKDITEFTTNTKIFYQMPDSSSGENKAKTVELTILGVLSGDFKSSQKPMFIKDHTNQ